MSRSLDFYKESPILSWCPSKKAPSASLSSSTMKPPAAVSVDMEDEPRRRNRWFIKAMIGVQAVAGVVRAVFDALEHFR